MREPVTQRQSLNAKPTRNLVEPHAYLMHGCVMATQTVSMAPMKSTVSEAPTALPCRQSVKAASSGVTTAGASTPTLNAIMRMIVVTNGLNREIVDTHES